MGTVRSYSPHVRWTKGEEEIIRLHYPTAPITELEARGGDDSLGNLQWVTRAANRAKRDLTDEEFLLLCKSCVAWIGQRINNTLRIAA